MKAWVKTLVTSAFILTYIVGLQFITTIKSKNNRVYRGVARRLSYHHPPPNFDPLVEKIERFSWLNERSNNMPSKAYINYDNDNKAGNYFNDGKLNITLRLMILFPALDVAPKDGTIDAKELEAWMRQQTINRLQFRTGNEMEYYDKNRDGAISFFEYLPKFSNEDIERNEMEHGKAGWWMEQFLNADVDKSGTLNLYEFRDFLHPEDSRNKQIHRWLLRQKIRQIDYNKDEKVDLGEFEDGAYDTYYSYMGYETKGEEDIVSPQVIFQKLDFNQDGFLDVEELRPILKYLCPGELSYAKYYSIYLINEADGNKDGKLTIDEMLRHEFVFYNTLYDGIDGEDIRDEL